jgi:hypothetical protein
MYSKKVSLIFVVAIILLFSLASMALAAPPLQTPDDEAAGSTVSDTLDLDNVKPNLGTVMSDQNSDADAAADPAGEEPDGDSPVGDQPDGEEPEGDDPAGDDAAGDDDLSQEHPVASALAGFFGVSYDEVMDMHLAGNGFGNIARAYFFADKLGMTPAEVLDAAHGSGWGNMLKENGLQPGNGKGPEKEKGTPPGQAKKDNAVDELSGQDNGNNGNNGNNGGNGKDKDKGKGKGKNK